MAGDGALHDAVLARIRRRIEQTPECAVPDWLTGPPSTDTAGDMSMLAPLGPVAAPASALILAAGLIETDIRFGAVFAGLQAPLASRRPCIGLLSWLLSGPDVDAADLVCACHDLLRRGLLQVDNPTDPRSEWIVRVPVAVWDVLILGRIDPGSLPRQIELLPGDCFPPSDQLALAESVVPVVHRLPAMIADGSVTAVLMRGMHSSGRTTVLGSVARLAGLDLLRFSGDTADPAWQLFGALASVADVLPVVRCDPGPGETMTIPALPTLDRPVGVVCGRTGSVSGPVFDRVITVTLPPCGPDDRRRLWRAGGLTDANADLQNIVQRFLLSPGNIRRAAPSAVVAARGAGRQVVTAEDVRVAIRTLRRQELDTLATWLEPVDAAGGPVLSAAAATELETLVRRCRHRETLLRQRSVVRAGLNRGVRALFAGPSGTGKTLTARYLAAVLELDLYRVDLAAVVNKYIGETERNLDRVLSRAEELDVLLLLDEGDALMTRRTEVSNANDRYANLETNFLLQRLETFEGIVIVTSNAANRIDPAFLRRIDVTVDFVPPDAEQRWLLWSEHLPVDHLVDPAVLDDAARRCALTGGQIRNAALHAILLSVERGTPLVGGDVVDAVRREYRRSGAACPIGESDTTANSVAGLFSVPSW